MIINYGSFAYILMLIAAGGVVAGIYFPLKNRTMRAKKIAVAVLVLLNLFQHLAKSIVWPHLYGQGFTNANTAYNMCAFLIIISPIVLFFGSELWRNYLAVLGTVAGAVAMLVPFWFIGKTLLSWEAARFYCCHILLFASSLLPALFGIYRIRLKNFWKIGFLYFLSLIIITFNNIAWNVIVGNTSDLFGTLYAANVCFMMHPPEQFPFLGKIFAALTPAIFSGTETSPPVPILYMAIPMYLFITVVCFGLFIGFDGEGRRNFLQLFPKRKSD